MDPAPQPARMCQKHGIVRDPFGHCVICRREDEDVDEDPSGVRLAATLLVLLAVGVAGVLFWRGTRGAKAPPAPEVAAVAPPAQAAPIEELSDAKQDALAAAQSRDAEDRRAAVERHMKDVPIRIYTGKQCDLCRTATGFLASKGYAYTEIDTDADREGLEAMRKLNPKNTVPTIVVGDEVIVGFGPTVVLSAIYRDAAKRVH
jgi:glutaredoxin 3